MKTIRNFPRIVLALTFGLCTSAMANETLDIDLKDAKGQSIGKATLTQLAKGVRIELRDVKLPKGTHAFHFHENGTCTAPGFTSAGGHYAPAKNAHGFNSAEGHHAGDMPNLIVDASGKISVEVINTHVSLKAGSNSLRKKGGTALVIHAAADDYKSQPAGNAGDRIACGEISEL